MSTAKIFKARFDLWEISGIVLMQAKWLSHVRLCQLIHTLFLVYAVFPFLNKQGVTVIFDKLNKTFAKYCQISANLLTLPLFFYIQCYQTSFAFPEGEQGVVGGNPPHLR